MTDTRRGGRERRGAGAQGRAGTRLAVEGDVAIADKDENPKRRAQGPRRGLMERRSTGAPADMDTPPGQRDMGHVMGTASNVWHNEKPDRMQ